MMKASWLKRLVLVAALAVMPLQGMAAMIAQTCHGDAQAGLVHDGGHDHGAQHDGQPDDGGAPASSGSHACCHSSIAAMPHLVLGAPLPDSPIRALAPDQLHDLFVPDQPQRPPLA